MVGGRVACSEQGHFDHAAAPAADVCLDEGAAQHEGRSDRVAEAEWLGEEREGGRERARLAQRRHRDRRHRRVLVHKPQDERLRAKVRVRVRAVVRVSRPPAARMSAMRMVPRGAS